MCRLQACLTEERQKKKKRWCDSATAAVLQKKGGEIVRMVRIISIHWDIGTDRRLWSAGPFPVCMVKAQVVAHC